MKSAVKELQVHADVPAVAKQKRPNKSEERCWISDAFGELLLLLGQKAAHAILTEKVELLHRHVQLLMGKVTSKA